MLKVRARQNSTSHLNNGRSEYWTNNGSLFTCLLLKYPLFRSHCIEHSCLKNNFFQTGRIPCHGEECCHSSRCKSSGHRDSLFHGQNVCYRKLFRGTVTTPILDTQIPETFDYRNCISLLLGTG